MADRLYRVAWNAGEITIHSSSPAQALTKALEYIAQPESNRITAELAPVTPLSKEIDEGARDTSL